MPTVLVKAIDQQGKISPVLFSAEISGEDTIYDGLEKAGHRLPHGCLSGSCGSCRVIILKGAEYLSAPMAIEADTTANVKQMLEEAGWQAPAGHSLIVRMACRAKVEGAGTVELAPIP